MSEEAQPELFSEITWLRLVQLLIADLHDDLPEKIARFHQLNDLSTQLGSNGTMIPGGETSYAAWLEARSSFVHGNFVATIMLCQGLAENILAAQLTLDLIEVELPRRVSFAYTLEQCLKEGFVTSELADDLRRLMLLRNPLSHFRSIDDPANLSRRVLDTQKPAEFHLLSDAGFAIGVAVRLLSLPIFRVDP